MNIFALDEDPVIAAQMQWDKHVVKMVLETAQLLSTAHRPALSDQAEHVYKMTHANHPSAVWCRASSANYHWLLRHFVGLLREYEYRYGRTHKCFGLFLYLQHNPVAEGPLTPVTPAMPDALKPLDLTWSSCVEAYRRYYLSHKRDLLDYTRRERPAWIKEKQYA